MRAIDVLAPPGNAIPGPRKPAKKTSLTEKLIWTGVVLVLYLVMSDIPLYGISSSVSSAFAQLNAFRIIFASTNGTLMQLGIGPIVTAGLVMQILAGSKLIDIDLSSEDDRAKFTASQRFLTIVFALYESVAFILGGAFGSLTLLDKVLVLAQLLFASYVVMLMDELLQKGWGIGSGVSLFILAGVAESVVMDSISPVMISGGPLGSIPYLIYVIEKHMPVWTAFIRPEGSPDMTGFISMIAVTLLLVWLQGMSVEIPVAYEKARGLRSKVPLQFLYVSNVPILLALILFAQLLFFGERVMTIWNPDNSNPILNFIGTFNMTNPSNPIPTGGILYYFQAPTGLAMTASHPLEAIGNFALLVGFSVIFAYLWVEVSGMGAREQAEQMVESGLQIPGFRREANVIESRLKGPISALTLISGLVVGVIAGVADMLGALGTGMGILLAVGIVFQLYQQLVQEEFLEIYPGLERFLGKS